MLAWAPIAVQAMFGISVVAFVAVMFIVAPYGRHVREGWGPVMPQWLGWVVMESPALWLVWGLFLTGSARSTAVWVLIAAWTLHYGHRVVVWPMRLSAPWRPMPVLVCALAFTFNLLNGFVQGTWLGSLNGYDASWLAAPQLWIGLAVFAAGEWMNHAADATLLALRKPGETGYKVPMGGMYHYVSCPNYLGEIIAWTGWAIATWSLAGLSFAVFTFANLAPRAVANHRWYRETFPDYPSTRRALIPFVW